jgi:hypothetical protein
MTLISSKIRMVAVAAVALLTTPLWGRALLQNGFESNTSAKDDSRVGDAAGTSINDDTRDGSYDYSALTDNPFASQTATPEALALPAAPNAAAGPSKDLKMTVNKNDNETARFARSLSPLTNRPVFFRITGN